MSKRISRCTRKLLAAALAIAMVGGAAFVQPLSAVMPAGMTAEAKEDGNNLSFEIKGDTLTIKSGTYIDPRLMLDQMDPNYPQMDTVSNIVAESDVVFIGDCSYMFSNLYNIQRIDLSNVTMYQVNDISYMFHGCGSLHEVILPGFANETIDSAEHMFENCGNLEMIDLRSLNGTKIRNLSGMFYNCSSLSFINDFRIDLSEATDMSNMFALCSSLDSIDLSNMNTSHVENMSGMFSNCGNLGSVGVGGQFSTESCQNMSYMFAYCESLTDLDLSNFSTDNCTSFYNALTGCTSLKHLDISSFDDTAAKQSGNDSYGDGLFSGSNIEELVLSNNFEIRENFELNNRYADPDEQRYGSGWTKDSGTEIVSGNGKYAVMSGAGTYRMQFSEMRWSYSFDNDRTLTLISGTYDTEAVKAIITAAENRTIDEGLYGKFDEYYDPVVHTLIVFDGVALTGDCSGIFALSGSDVSDYHVVFIGHISTQGMTGMKNMFSTTYGSPVVTGLDLRDFDTSMVTDMTGALRGLTLDMLDLSSFDTSKVEKMSGMFMDCTANNIIFGTGFDTSKVYAMGSMFKNCSNLANIDLSKFDTQNVGNEPEDVYFDNYDFTENDMASMFSGCKSLVSLNCPGFLTLNVKDMSCMFCDCTNLKNLVIGSFDTMNVEDLSGMFKGCASIENIDLGNISTGKVRKIDEMFMDCSSLTTLKLGEGFTLDNLYQGFDGMFSGCSSLSSVDLSMIKGNDQLWSVREMFEGCSSLREADLSSINMSGVNTWNNAFEGCSSMKKITFPDTFLFPDYGLSNVFTGCFNLSEIVVPEDITFTADHCLPNVSVLYSAWHKQGSEQIVSGTGRYAEFTTAGETEEAKVTYKRDRKDYTDSTVLGSSLTLEGQIGVNFYAVFPETVDADSGSYVIMSGPCGDVKMFIKDAAFDVTDGYKFTYKVPAKCLHDEITFTVYDGSGNKQQLKKSTAEGIVDSGSSYSGSVQDYIDAIKKNAAQYGDKLMALVTSLETYGNNAQLYFNYKTDTVSQDVLAVSQNITYETLSDYRYDVPDYLPAGVGFLGYSLILESETAMRLYFTIDNINSFTFSYYDSDTSETVYMTPVNVSDNTYYIEYGNISAQEIYYNTYVGVYEGDEYAFTVSIRPLSYVYSALNQRGDKTDAKNVALCNTMRALYLYGNAAKDYFDSLN